MSTRLSRRPSRVRTTTDRRTTEAGRMVTMVPLAALAALICVGIGVDFAGQTMAEQDLRDQVAACARSSGDWASMAATPAIDSVGSAYQCLFNYGISGTVTYEDETLTVHATGAYQTQLLSIVGVFELPTRATASVGVAQGW